MKAIVLKFGHHLVSSHPSLAGRLVRLLCLMRSPAQAALKVLHHFLPPHPPPPLGPLVCLARPDRNVVCCLIKILKKCFINVLQRIICINKHRYDLLEYTSVYFGANHFQTPGCHTGLCNPLYHISYTYELY